MSRIAIVRHVRKHDVRSNRTALIWFRSCQYVVAGGSAEDGDGPLGHDGRSDVSQRPRIGRSAGSLSFPHVTFPDREDSIRHIEVQLKVGIEVWTIEHRHVSI